MIKILKGLMRLTLGAVMLGTSFSALGAWPQDKTVTLVVPFPPGGNTDTLARIVAHHLTSTLGPTVIVENKPGGGSMIGSQAVARARPDGYTFLVGSISNVLNHFFYKKPLYDIEKDLVPVAQLVAVPNYLAVNGNSNISSLSELIALAKSKPDEISCATTGIGTSPYLSCELFRMMSGAKILNVPYKGGAAAMQDVMGGQASMVVANEALPYIKDGRLKGLAVTTAERSPLAPDIPAVSETLPGYDVTAWYGVFAPTGTPPDIIARISKEVAQVLKKPEVLEKLQSLGATPVGSSPDQFKSYVSNELKRWEATVKPLNISLD